MYVKTLSKTTLKVEEGPRKGFYQLYWEGTQKNNKERDRLKARMVIFFKIIEKYKSL